MLPEFPLHHVTYAPAKFEVATPNSLRGDAFARKYILWPWCQGHINVAQYPLHDVNYAPTKFEVALSNGLGGDAFTRKYILWPWCKGYRKFAQYPSHQIHSLTLRSMSHEMSPSALYIMWPMHLQRGSSKSAHALILIIFCMLNTYVITTTKMKLFHSSKAVRPQGGTLMYTLCILIYDLLNISFKSLTLLTATLFYWNMKEDFSGY